MENEPVDSTDSDLEEKMVIVGGPMSPTLFIVLLALMTALTTVATVVFVIPFPSTSGYFNLGDMMVMISGILLGPVGGLIAGGVGSAMGDVVLNYIPFAPITLVVKGCEGLIVGFVSRKAMTGTKFIVRDIKFSIWDILALILGSIVMLVGYLVCEIALLGISFEFALLELITINSIQVIMGSILAILIGPFLRSFLSNYTSSSD